MADIELFSQSHYPTTLLSKPQQEAIQAHIVYALNNDDISAESWQSIYSAILSNKEPENEELKATVQEINYYLTDWSIDKINFARPIIISEQKIDGVTVRETVVDDTPWPTIGRVHHYILWLIYQKVDALHKTKIDLVKLPALMPSLAMRTVGQLTTIPEKWLEDGSLNEAQWRAYVLLALAFESFNEDENFPEESVIEKYKCCSIAELEILQELIQNNTVDQIGTPSECECLMKTFMSAAKSMSVSSDYIEFSDQYERFKEEFIESIDYLIAFKEAIATGKSNADIIKEFAEKILTSLDDPIALEQWVNQLIAFSALYTESRSPHARRPTLERFLIQTFLNFIPPERRAAVFANARITWFYQSIIDGTHHNPNYYQTPRLVSSMLALINNDFKGNPWRDNVISALSRLLALEETYLAVSFSRLLCEGDASLKPEYLFDVLSRSPLKEVLVEKCRQTMTLKRIHILITNPYLSLVDALEPEGSRLLIHDVLSRLPLDRWVDFFKLPGMNTVIQSHAELESLVARVGEDKRALLEKVLIIQPCSQPLDNMPQRQAEGRKIMLGKALVQYLTQATSQSWAPCFNGLSKKKYKMVNEALTHLPEKSFAETYHRLKSQHDALAQETNKMWLCSNRWKVRRLGWDERVDSVLGEILIKFSPKKY